MNIKFKQVIAGSAIVFIVLFCFFLFLASSRIRNKDHLSWRYYVGNHRRKPVTQADIVYISPWMTFDYINKIFDLPPSYLEQTLNINDSKYPLITVQKYSKNVNTNSVIVVESIRKSVKHYLASSTPQ
jgi:heme/copper-type cytochrome/quinol oxidase subunit 2